MDRLTAELGDEINDADEEVFGLFSQSIPSNALGFVDPETDHVSVVVGDEEYEIRQSTHLLRSSRPGTTGALLWQVTPRFARWIIDAGNVLTSTGILTPESIAIELGCGVSGVLGLALAPIIKQYIITDQDYVLKILRNNIESNQTQTITRRAAKSKRLQSTTERSSIGNIVIKSLDWETDDVESFVKQLQVPTIDLVLACDCVYNEALVNPFIDACAEICKTQPGNTVCVIAQQLRSFEVFEFWLKSFHQQFRVWRVPNHLISADLGEDSGFVVHVGILRR